MITPVSPAPNCCSITKSFTAAGIGLLRDNSLISLDDKALKFFKPELPSKYDARMEKATARNLLLHTTGIAEGYLFEADKFTHGTDDWVLLCLSWPLAFEPGEHQAYSNYQLLSSFLHHP